MLGGDRAARQSHKIIDHVRNLRLTSANPLPANVEMDIAVAQMAKGGGGGAGERPHGRCGGIGHEGGHPCDRHADIILQRGSLRPLGL